MSGVDFSIIPLQGKEGDKIYFVYGKWDHMAKNYWQRKRREERIVKNTTRVGKRKQRTVSSQLAFNNLYSVLYPEKLKNKNSYQNNTKKVRNMQHILQLLREVWMKVGLEKLKNYKDIAVKALLDSGATGLFMDTKFAKKKGLNQKN